MENCKKERISGETDRFATDSCGLLTRCGRVWFPFSANVRHIVLEEVHNSRF